jgi:hypothetical protein
MVFDTQDANWLGSIHEPPPQSRTFFNLMLRETGITLKVFTGTEPQEGRIESTTDAIGNR